MVDEVRNCADHRGCGVIAIIVAFLSQTPKQSINNPIPATVSSPTQTGSASEPTSTKPELKPEGKNQPPESLKRTVKNDPGADAGDSAKVPSRRAPIDPSSVKFYIYDLYTDLAAKGENIVLPWDERFSLRWDARSVSSDGPVTVTCNGKDGRPYKVSGADASVGNELHATFHCAYGDGFHFEMKQDLFDGLTRTLGMIDVKCEH